MDLLFFGGTRFSGFFSAERALARGHRVTLVHRGGSLAEGELTGAEHIVGDRRSAEVLGAIAARDFDAVIDFCGMFPADVRAAADALGGRGHYVYVSTESVYADTSRPGLDESAPVHPPAGDDVDTITYATYGPLKVACEREARAGWGDGACIVRPGLIVGPRDRSDRFTWWPVRLAEGGRAIAPGPPEQRVQCVDARDLAAFLVDCAECRRGGVFNVDGNPLPMRDVVDVCRRAAGHAAAELTWVDGAWLEARDVGAWMDLPLWVGTGADVAGFGEVSNARARAAGLVLRPLADTARDTLAWFRAHRGGRDALATGLSAEREASLLAEWASGS